MFNDWIGRQTSAEDIVTERLVALYRATLEPFLAEVGSGQAPLALHWCLFPPRSRTDELAADGHPQRNVVLLPTIPLPRRMWAGGQVEALDPLLLGDRVRRLSTIRSVDGKQGRSGELYFVSIDHEYSTDRGPAIRERQDIVYREAAGAPPTGNAKVERRKSAYRTSWTINASSTLLFRYSALTFNSHRIHYDHAYATKVEGYAGLLVHGPLQATLLYNLLATTLASVPRRFAYRGLAPAIAGVDLHFRTLGDSAWSEGPTGQVHMDAQAL